jgi:hypothetical protein
MIKNRTAQLIFQSAFCAIGIIGIIASFGFFDMVWRWDFYIQFTNLSNYFCVAIMFAELIQTAKKKEDSFVSALPLLKFVGVLLIFLTFVVFNFAIAQESTRDPALNYKINSVTFHVVLPIMFIADWLLFYEKKKVKISWPFISVLFILCYGIFIFIHAAIYKFDSSVLNYFGTGPFIYPYFFLNIDTYGVGGVLLWMLGLGVVFVVIGFVFYGIDRVISRLQKKK